MGGNFGVVDDLTVLPVVHRRLRSSGRTPTCRILNFVIPEISVPISKHRDGETHSIMDLSGDNVENDIASGSIRDDGDSDSILDVPSDNHEHENKEDNEVSNSDSDQNMEEERDNEDDSGDEEWTASDPESFDVSRKRRYRFTARNPRAKKVSNLRHRWDKGIPEPSIKLKELQCCRMLKCFEVANVGYLHEKIKEYRKMNVGQRKDVLNVMLSSDGSFYFDGRAVCSTFLLKSFRFTRMMQSNIRKFRTTNDDMVTESAPRQGSSSSFPERCSPQRDAIVSYLERLAEDTGDRMPDRNEYHLPFFKKQDVYDAFEKDFELLHRGKQKPSPDYFFRTWKEHCHSIKVRKNSRFSKCDTCETLRASLRNAVLNRVSTMDLKERKSAHLRMVWQERLQYKKNRDRAILQPSQYMSMIIDGADQSAFGLPHFTVKTKNERGHSIKVKLVGVLQHGVQNHLRLYTLTDEHQTGANHIIESLHRSISDISEKCKLPRRFNLQVDNCGRENKNKFVFSFLECLVQWGVFDEVIVGFLPVGHTHEDIDQTFSRTSERLRNRDAITLSDLHNELSQTYNKNTQVSHMDKIANWSGLCGKEKCLTSVEGVSQFQYFRIVLNKENTISKPSNSGHTSGKQTRCFVKMRCTDEWSQLQKTDPDKSFIAFCPDLPLTPNTQTMAPPDLSEVNKRLRSEEGRINSRPKMNALYELRDKIYTNRTDIFHWDPSSCFELSTCNFHNTNDHQDSGNNEEDDSNDYTYDVNSFVVVNESSKVGSFWVARIVEVKSPSCLVVHWYERTTSEDSLMSKYSASYITDTVRKRQVPWTDKIPDSSVISNFESLTRSRTIPMAVRKQIMEFTSTLSG